MEGRQITAHIWRRGRGIIEWQFDYITDSSEHWFSSPGWYHRAKKNTYRLTLDHDYPTRPIWLGYRNRKWRNAETLYEVLYIQHRDFVIASKVLVKSKRRSDVRKRCSHIYLQQEVRKYEVLQ